jgi:phenylacetate-CoA ligase
LVNRFRLFSYDEREMHAFANKLRKAEYIEGYSSMIYEVAKYINQNQLKGYNLRMVKGTSEKIYDHYQSEIKRAFNKNMISEYGACETGIIAYECPYANMHVVMENVIAEEIDGEAVITNLNSDSFPIIRYKLGDCIKLDTTKLCGCGMHHDIIDEVLGRTGSIIDGYESRYPSLTLYYIFKRMALEYGLSIRYQVIQTRRGEIEVCLERNISELEKERLLDCIRMYYKDDVNVILKYQLLKNNCSGKFKDFIKGY